MPADTGTFNALIRACVRGGALEAALNIFEFLVSGRDVTDPVPANIDTYNMLIHACHQVGLFSGRHGGCRLEEALETVFFACKHLSYSTHIILHTSHSRAMTDM